jgi:acyl carrier protein
MNPTMEKINEVFRDVFDDDDITVGRETTAADVDGWDSVMHVTLLINMEKAFGMKFSSSAVAGLKSVGDLAALIEAHQASQKRA